VIARIGSAKSSRSTFSTVIAVVVLGARMGHAAPLPQSAPASQSGRQAYCGIYCLWAYLNLAGDHKPEFSALLQPRYIGSERGSSAAELIQAARDQHVFASALSGMTSTTLKDMV
jgi:hypothetical protein